MGSTTGFRLFALTSLVLAVVTAAAFVSLLGRSSHTPVGGTFYPGDVKDFDYAGRWEVNQHVARADWPCSGVQFSVTSVPDREGPFSIALRLNLHRVRAKVSVTNADTGAVESETIIEGNPIFNFEKNYDIHFENKSPGTYAVSLTKLTQAAPYGNGVGRLLTSILEFHGVEIDTNLATLGPAPLPSRRVTIIGASDTAGYCVDGSPETSDSKINPWKYDNCDMTSHSTLGKRLNAGVSVQAIAGIGLTQNAFADKPFLLGKNTMPQYYNRRLETVEEPLKNNDEWRPDLVVVSLGGNDFNHQKTVPSNETFHTAYEEFLLKVAKPYMDDGAPPTVVSVCGQGDPTEVERDPNNDRCRPCPHVKGATDAFRAKYGDIIRTEYIFIPCDGTVVTGKDDIGCDGHKNRLGQKKVADYLEPRLRDIMDWPEEINEANLAQPSPEPPVETTVEWENPSGVVIAAATFFGLVAFVLIRRAAFSM